MNAQQKLKPISPSTNRVSLELDSKTVAFSSKLTMKRSSFSVLDKSGHLENNTYLEDPSRRSWYHLFHGRSDEKTNVSKTYQEKWVGIVKNHGSISLFSFVPHKTFLGHIDSVTLWVRTSFDWNNTESSTCQCSLVFYLSWSWHFIISLETELLYIHKKHCQQDVVEICSASSNEPFGKYQFLTGHSSTFPAYP